MNQKTSVSHYLHSNSSYFKHIRRISYFFVNMKHHAIVQPLF